MAYLEGNEQGDSLNTVVASVYIVSHEQIVRVRAFPTDPEELHQVMELTVHIATHCHGALHLQ